MPNYERLPLFCCDTLVELPLPFVSKFLIALTAAFGVAAAGARPALDRPVRLAPEPVAALGLVEVR